MKRIIRVTRLAISAGTADPSCPEVFYQPQVARGMLYITEDIEQMNFKTNFHTGPELIRVETTNLIYVKV